MELRHGLLLHVACSQQQTDCLDAALAKPAEQDKAAHLEGCRPLLPSAYSTAPLEIF